MILRNDRLFEYGHIEKKIKLIDKQIEYIAQKSHSFSFEDAMQGINKFLLTKNNLILQQEKTRDVLNRMSNKNRKVVAALFESKDMVDFSNKMNKCLRTGFRLKKAALKEFEDKINEKI